MKDATSTEDEDEEQKLLESLGLLHLINEPSEQEQHSSSGGGGGGGGGDDRSFDGDGEASSTWNRLRNVLSPAPPSSSSSSGNKILLGIGGTLFLLPHLAIILSLPPVLQRRGAPYLPTFGNKLDIMFDLIRRHVTTSPSSLKFVDLGSGDGRVVFRAAREGIFHKSVGYEINPALHMWVKFRQMITPKYWSSTKFYLGDLWNIKLQKYDVVAVYGLYPIMDRLGKKLQQELKPGSIVVSNVFEIPNWKAVSSTASASSQGKGVYLYQVPECYKSSITNRTKV